MKRDFTAVSLRGGLWAGPVRINTVDRRSDRGGVMLRPCQVCMRDDARRFSVPPS